MASRKPRAAAPIPDELDSAAAADPRDQIIARLQNQLARMEERFAADAVELLPPVDMPQFEVGPGGYYSADDVLYPEGVIVEDVTGFMPLNEQLVPVNEPARARMERYLGALPQHGTPSHEFVLDAAFQLLGEQSANPRDRHQFYAEALERAAKLRMTQRGLMPHEGAPRAASPRTAAQRSAVPLMSNTRIRHDAGPTGILPQGALARGAVKTRARTPAVAPASKAAPPMGSVATTNLGTASPGARAA